MSEAKDEFRDFIAELKGKSDIVTYIGEAVPLRRTGRSFKGLCPFHAEKTPSFHVDPQRQMFHCFGCGKGGDILSFVMEHEHLPFVEAAKKVAARFGVTVPEWRPASAQEQAAQERKHQLAGALAAAKDLFEERLYGDDVEGRRARRYLKGRGLDSTIARAFCIGYAPQDPTAIEKVLGAKGIAASALRDAGLLHLGRGGDAVGAFRGRVTFAIRSASGKVLGFSARIIEKGEPKYINSPDSPIFRKGHNLYGLYEAVKSLRGGAGAILVEGNLDVVSLHHAGFTSAVAPLGTALTEEQARLIETHASKVTVMFDGDSAGHRATLRALPILLSCRLEVTVATLPDGADPDSLVREKGREAIDAALSTSTDPITFVLDELCRGLDLSQPRFRARVMEGVTPYLLSVSNPVGRQACVQVVAERLGMDDRAVAEALGSRKPRRRPETAVSESPQAATQVEAPTKKAERILLAAFLRHPELPEKLAPVREALGEVMGSVDAMWSPPGRELFAEVLRLASDVGSSPPPELHRVTDPGIRGALEAILKEMALEPLDFAQAKECLSTLFIEWSKSRQRELDGEIKAAERSGDRKRALELSSRSQELARARDSMQR